MLQQFSHSVCFKKKARHFNHCLANAVAIYTCSYLPRKSLFPVSLYLFGTVFQPETLSFPDTLALTDQVPPGHTSKRTRCKASRIKI